MTRTEKRQARVEYYKSMSLKANSQSNEVAAQARKMHEMIPFGQPILIGHHSERGDRAYRGRMWAKDEKAYQLSKKADYYANKAKTAENNNSIYIEDENSIEKLQSKIDVLTKFQETMKLANKIVKNKKLSDEQKVEELQKVGISESSSKKILTPDFCNRIGFASYSLTNNNARIKAAEIQLAKAKALKELETKEYKIGEVEICENADENRLQLFFEGKPSDVIRTKLKHSGFRWSPSNGCWQSYLNSRQIETAKEILNSIL